jgi:magnesium chelatase family protein
MKQLKCASIDGFEAISVDVESTFCKGLPSFSIVGLGNTAIQESKDRIKSALLTNEYKFPPKKITINLSPSEIAKSGSQFDVTIALLIALQEQNIKFDDFYVFGELGLDGALKDTKSIFVLILSLARQGLIKNILIPQESVNKISTIPNINIYAVDNLTQAIDFFMSNNKELKKVENANFDYDFLDINNTKYYYTKKYPLDFNEVKGQTIAKRAALISAAGNHNIIFEGSPGCGKSMIANRLRYILPPMDASEILDLAKLDVLDGKEPAFKPHRTYKNPHHSSTPASVFGGGSFKAKIGEVGLANNGILFFDELPHFTKGVLESLREPMQDGKIRISRVNSKVEYPAKFLFVGAMNPCPCGNLLDMSKECRCSDLEVQRYKNRLSDPFLDRIDLNVVMQNVNANDKASLSSKEMHKMVVESHIRAKRRGQEEFNANLSDKDIEKFCALSQEVQETLDMATSKFVLSFRSIKKVQKVARTIADLAKSSEIQKEHLLEALSYRRR